MDNIKKIWIILTYIPGCKHQSHPLFPLNWVVLFILDRSIVSTVVIVGWMKYRVWSTKNPVRFIRLSSSTIGSKNTAVGVIFFCFDKSIAFVLCSFWKCWFRIQDIRLSNAVYINFFAWTYILDYQRQSQLPDEGHQCLLKSHHKQYYCPCLLPQPIQ